MATLLPKEDQLPQQVVQAAQRLYQQYGLQKVTMDDVAQAVGKSKSALYYYYKSKEEIFEAVIKAELREIFAVIAQAVQAAETTEEKIHAYFITRLDLSRQKPTSFATLDDSATSTRTAGFRQTKAAIQAQFIEQEHAAVKQLLVAGIANGEVRALGEAELEVTVFVITSSFRGLKQEVLASQDAQLERAAAATIAALVANGLRT